MKDFFKYAFPWLLVIGLLAGIFNLSCKNEPQEPEQSQLIEYQSPTSGFISSGEYMAAFQEFGDGIYWIRIQRKGFEEKAEFEVHSLNEARELLEKFSESGR